MKIHLMAVKKQDNPDGSVQYLVHLGGDPVALFREEYDAHFFIKAKEKDLLGKVFYQEVTT